MTSLYQQEWRHCYKQMEAKKHLHLPVTTAPLLQVDGGQSDSGDISESFGSHLGVIFGIIWDGMGWDYDDDDDDDDDDDGDDDADDDGDDDDV